MRSSSRITDPTKPKTLNSFARQPEAEGRPHILRALGHEVATLGPRDPIRASFRHDVVPAGMGPGR
jgi:hypothetical protein